MNPNKSEDPFEVPDVSTFATLGQQSTDMIIGVARLTAVAVHRLIPQCEVPKQLAVFVVDKEMITPHWELYKIFLQSRCARVPVNYGVEENGKIDGWPEDVPTFLDWLISTRRYINYVSRSKWRWFPSVHQMDFKNLACKDEEEVKLVNSILVQVAIRPKPLIYIPHGNMSVPVVPSFMVAAHTGRGKAYREIWRLQWTCESFNAEAEKFSATKKCSSSLALLKYYGTPFIWLWKTGKIAQTTIVCAAISIPVTIGLVTLFVLPRRFVYKKRMVAVAEPSINEAAVKNGLGFKEKETHPKVKRLPLAETTRAWVDVMFLLVNGFAVVTASVKMFGPISRLYNSYATIDRASDNVATKITFLAQSKEDANRERAEVEMRENSKSFLNLTSARTSTTLESQIDELSAPVVELKSKDLDTANEIATGLNEQRWEVLLPYLRLAWETIKNPWIYFFGANVLLTCWFMHRLRKQNKKNLELYAQLMRKQADYFESITLKTFDKWMYTDDPREYTKWASNEHLAAIKQEEGDIPCLPANEAKGKNKKGARARDGATYRKAKHLLTEEEYAKIQGKDGQFDSEAWEDAVKYFTNKYEQLEDDTVIATNDWEMRQNVLDRIYEEALEDTRDYFNRKHGQKPVEEKVKKLTFAEPTIITTPLVEVQPKVAAEMIITTPVVATSGARNDAVAEVSLESIPESKPKSSVEEKQTPVKINEEKKAVVRDPPKRENPIKTKKMSDNEIDPNVYMVEVAAEPSPVIIKVDLGKNVAFTTMEMLGFELPVYILGKNIEGKTFKELSQATRKKIAAEMNAQFRMWFLTERVNEKRPLSDKKLGEVAVVKNEAMLKHSRFVIGSCPFKIETFVSDPVNDTTGNVGEAFIVGGILFTAEHTIAVEGEFVDATVTYNNKSVKIPKKKWKSAGLDVAYTHTIPDFGVPLAHFDISNFDSDKMLASIVTHLETSTKGTSQSVGKIVKYTPTNQEMLYDASTTGAGSSGSPLLDAEGRVIGMHLRADGLQRTNAGVYLVPIVRQIRSGKV